MPFDAFNTSRSNRENRDGVQVSTLPKNCDAEIHRLFKLLRIPIRSAHLLRLLIYISNGEIEFELSNRSLAEALFYDTEKTANVRALVNSFDKWQSKVGISLLTRIRVGSRVTGNDSAIEYKVSKYRWTGLAAVVQAFYAGDLKRLTFVVDSLVANAPAWTPNAKTHYPSERIRIERKRKTVKTLVKQIAAHDQDQGLNPTDFPTQLSQTVEYDWAVRHLEDNRRSFQVSFESRLEAHVRAPEDQAFDDPSMGGRQKTTPYNHYLTRNELKRNRKRGGANDGMVPNRTRPTPENGQKGRLRAALNYADEGLPVFPCHSTVDLGNGYQCTCRSGKECPNPGKHPRCKRGLDSATTDRSKIKRWWKSWPDANIAIATGRGSGIFVLDVDSQKGGVYALEELREQYKAVFGASCEPLSETAVSTTGGGGLHYFYRYPAGLEISNSTEKIGAGLDIRGDGGYVIAPGSSHISGAAYRWAGSGIEIGNAPDWLVYEAIRKEDTHQAPEEDARTIIFSQKDLIPIGMRNDALFMWGCGLINSFPFVDVKELLKTRNKTGTEKPLNQKEINTLIRSVMKYSKGMSATDGYRRLGHSTVARELV